MILLFAYLFLALFTSFLCSILESVLLSTPVSFLRVKKNKGSKTAAKLINMKKNIDRPLSAILSLNTIAHTIGAAGVGAQATIVFGEAYFGIVSAVLTILILVITEIIPKTLGARYWKKLIIPSGKIIFITIIITYPLVKLSGIISGLFSAGSKTPSTSREEIAALAKIGAEEGILMEKENIVIENMLRLKNVSVTDIKTPRVVVTAADEDMSLSDFKNNFSFLNFSRIPVYSGNQDNITGYVLRQTALEKFAEGFHDLKLKEIKRNIIVVRESMPAYRVWEILLERKEQIVLIDDEFGGMAGIVTMEDILEAMLGFEIIDEKDTITDMQKYARERWQKRQEEYRILSKIRKK